MNTLEVQIIKLEPMRVVRFHAISETPENDALEKLREWSGPRGLLDDLEKHPVFGFNNPDPSPQSKEYGYEFWIRVSQNFEAEDGVEVKDYEGGLYAIASCKLHEEVSSEFFQKEGFLESWKKLHDWVEESPYKSGSHQYLEKAHDPSAAEEDLVLDLYHPIEE